MKREHLIFAKQKNYPGYSLGLTGPPALATPPLSLKKRVKLLAIGNAKIGIFNFLIESPAVI
ncbi:MAG: hypothetical protein CM15mP109_11060 [Candidatus Dadabacteria bacterium]|nr:MAG: hypothetical protein CM15mP109_11060 [Candidatus Dadabacteria bacterium]